MKATEYFDRQTKEGIQLAIQLSTEAIKLDSYYAQAYYSKATALAVLYRGYDQTPALLDEAETLCKEALTIKPDLFWIYQPLSMIYMLRGQLDEAEEVAEEYIRKAPQDFYSHFALGFFYENTLQYAKAIEPYEEAVRLVSNSLACLVNLVNCCEVAGKAEKCGHWARATLPLVERHLKLHPDDETMRVWYATILFLSGKTEEAYSATLKLTNLKDSVSLYNTANIFRRLGDLPEALRTFRKSIEAGFRSIHHLKEFLTDEKEGIPSLAGTTEYEEVKRMVEKLSEP
jgi:tetratricopeptide (TPR) repeat protein